MILFHLFDNSIYHLKCDTKINLKPYYFILILHDGSSMSYYIRHTTATINPLTKG